MGSASYSMVCGGEADGTGGDEARIIVCGEVHGGLLPTTGDGSHHSVWKVLPRQAHHHTTTFGAADRSKSAAALIGEFEKEFPGNRNASGGV